MADLPHKISVLVYVRDAHGRLLLMRRRKAPNLGKWSCVGGKLEAARGESPHECAARELFEETGHAVGPGDLHLFATIAEKAYEGRTHFLMFLFDCRKPLPGLPPPMDEGEFAFFEPSEVAGLDIPETDRVGLWPAWFRHREGFVALRADCTPGIPLEVVEEESFGPAGA